MSLELGGEVVAADRNWDLRHQVKRLGAITYGESVDRKAGS